MLLFGDGDGNITLADRNFNVLQRQQAFKGEVKGLAYVYDPSNHRKQYVYAVGGNDTAGASTAMQEVFYMIKVTFIPLAVTLVNIVIF